jgi:putative flippase GtrA
MRLTRQIVWFCVAGVIGLAVDLAVLYASAPWLNWYGARIVSFLSAATATWAFNRRLTFHDGGRTASIQFVALQYLRYLAAMLVGGGVNYSVYVLVLNSYSGVGGPALGVAAGSLAGLVINFTLARYAVFSHSSRQPTKS